MREFTEQDRPLYRWKLEKDKRIVKHVITKWEERTHGSGYYACKYYEFRLSEKSNVTSIKVADVGTMNHGRYYSFEDDDEKAKMLFMKYFTDRVNRSQRELDRDMEMLEEFKKINT